MNRGSKIPYDKLQYESNVKANAYGKYGKFIGRITNIFKNDMFDKLIELNEKIKK